MDKNIILRYGEPSKFDEADFGTICKVKHLSHKNFDIYVQTNKDGTPSWEYIDTFHETFTDFNIQKIIYDRLQF